MLQLTSTELASFFPELSEDVIRDLYLQQESDHDDATLVRHILFLVDDNHWLNVLVREARNSIPLTVIVRGLPGSGKSTLARLITLAALQPGQNESDGVIVSADAFFIDRDGQYTYVPTLLDKAHQWCQNKARTAMKQGKRIVIVDNTNVQAWEILPYCKISAQQGYRCLILEPNTSWKLHPPTLARKNSHGVQLDKIKAMKKRLEPLSIQSICANLPRNLKPQTTSIEELLQTHGKTNAAAKAEAVGGQGDQKSGEFRKRSEDFQSLLQCFPNMDLDEAFYHFYSSNGNIEKTMNAILDTNKKVEEINQLDQEPSENNFEILLDAQFANLLENSFGTVRGGQNFPGALSFRIPPMVARLLHHFWTIAMKDKLSQAEIIKLLDGTNGINSRIFCSARANSPAVSEDDSNSMISLNSMMSDLARAEEEKPETLCSSKPISREEINQLKERRSEVYQKAAAAFKAKQGGVAAYYSEEGRKLTDKIERLEIEHRYQKYLNENRNEKGTSLDLHGLTVNEALENLEWFIEDNKENLKSSSNERIRLEVITGKGTKSKAKIKPAVTNYLERNDVIFTEVNPGSLEIVVRRSRL